ncbi:hypothetical protein F5B22DRAFT_620916 [Xylaria bambusicola]|uniref:uncharacterized protein n=1 Tax=Xylaria bambusicola TaxID=326684 RepID=UPI0020073FB5|nr:uncharacterized protein F5B22DRAFT_620916 [Xylaria bambusicola]KAI0508352.1 hypothetical protein F5B22DRAFT_620916 [Xylaria bambusicola]
MRLNGLTVFSTLALSACLSHAASVNEAATSLRSISNAGVAIQSDRVSDNAVVDNSANVVEENENQDDEIDNNEEEEEEAEENDENGEENVDENENEGENENVDENLDQNDNKNNDNNNDNNNDDAENNNKDDLNNIGQFLNGSLGDGFNDILIDPNDIQGSLGQNILNLLLSMGICNFNIGSLGGLSLGNEIQLLLQLQQLQQLQALGIVNSFTIDQLIQREILSKTFNLNIIKRSINASVKQAARSRKRTVMLKRQCANAGQSQRGASEKA